MAKRANGEGSIFKRSDGLWCAAKYIEQPDGTFKRKYIYAKTQKAVKEKLKRFEELEKIPEDASILLQDWMIQWLDIYKKLTIKETTYDNYRMNINTHIRGTGVGQTALKDLTTNALQKFYNNKFCGEKRLSRRTVEYLRVIIGGALEQACKNGLIEKNVNTFTVLPKKETKEIVPLTVEELNKIIVASEGTRLYPLLILEIFTGMRKGEILGLQWTNVDLKNGMIYVKKSLGRVTVKDGTGERKTMLKLMDPKTQKSVRSIPISAEVVKVLKAHRKNQMEEKMKNRCIYQDLDLVFANEQGAFVDPRELLRSFHKLLEKGGVRKCRFHDLRHSFASVLINQGESMKIIQELLGHSTITTTMDIYSHVAQETKKQSVEALGKVLCIREA